MHRSKIFTRGCHFKNTGFCQRSALGAVNRENRGGDRQRPKFKRTMDPNLVCLIVGFALGFGVRSALSKYRRAQVRKRINSAGNEPRLGG
jgi:hypothetical protein